MVERFDRPDTLFYLDPPYWGCESDYGVGVFSREDFAELATLLATIKGRFVLSLNDRPEVRETFSAFAVEGVSTRYSVGNRSGGKQVGEVLIANFDLPRGGAKAPRN